MYIFISDYSMGPKSTLKEIYKFHSKVLSSLNVDDLTYSQINKELRKRLIARFVSCGNLVLVFKKI
jgi:hypothetical protein